MPTPNEPLTFKSIIFYRPAWMIWLFRITFSLNILIPCIPYESHYYPAIVLFYSIIAYWLDMAKLTWLALIIMAGMLLINYHHLFGDVMRE